MVIYKKGMDHKMNTFFYKRIQNGSWGSPKNFYKDQFLKIWIPIVYGFVKGGSDLDQSIRFVQMAENQAFVHIFKLPEKYY